MSPPGRRKALAFPLIPLLALLLLVSSARAASAVLGIDLGTEYIKAAIARPGSPIDIVLTKDSKRKEAATLTFKPNRAQANDEDAFPERLYGGDAVALAARFPSDVYPNIKTLLGLDSTSETVQIYSSRYPGLDLEPISRSEETPGAGTVGFRSRSFGERKEVFMVEELLAMQLKNIKSNAEAMVAKGTSVSDVVITYPAFYTAEEKRAIELAADLAGLNLQALLSDGLAVGLNYATSRTFDSVSDGSKPEYHVIYDMGAGSTTATVLKFQGRTIKGTGSRNTTIQEVIALGAGSDRTLGGDALNDIIVADMIEQFLTIPKVMKLNLDTDKVRSSGKTMARLWKDAERIRQLLSANVVSSASFEGLYDEDIGFKYSLTRERFEKLAEDHASKVGRPLGAALQMAGLELDDINSIILHGGLIRTPFIQKELEAVAGGAKKLKSNVNADEAAAMGAAFKAAALSSSFRVKDIRDIDISGTAVSLKWTIDGKEKSQKLFTPVSPIGVEKQVPVRTVEDVMLHFTQDVGDRANMILAVEAANLSQSTQQLKDKYGCSYANISTLFNIRLSPRDGIPEVVSGSVSCEPDKGEAGGVMDNVKGLFGFGSKKDDEQKVLADEDESNEESTKSTPLPVEDSTSSSSTASSTSDTGTASASSTSASSSVKAAKQKPTTVSIPLLLKPTVLGLNALPTAILPQTRQRLKQFDTSDRNAVLRAEALNTLEAFTYRARDYLEDEAFVAVSTEDTRKEIERELSSASEWLYGDGADAKAKEFRDRLRTLQALVDPVLKRKDEAGKREEATMRIRSSIDAFSGMIQMITSKIEKDAEEAASSASAAAEAASSSTTPPASSATSEDDLDDDPYSATSTAEPIEGEDEPAVKAPEYTQEELSVLTEKYEEVKTWFEEKLALQEKLTPYDEPAFLAEDLNTRAQELQSTIASTMMKRIKANSQGKPKSSKKAKGKGKSSKTESASASSSSSTSSTSPSPSATSVKDEL